MPIGPATARLFFALWPDADTRARLAQCAAQLVVREGRRVSQENLHITLIFLGLLTAEQQGSAEQAAAAAQVPEFELLLDTAGYWSRPRVAWLGVSRVPAELLDLVAELRRGLEAAGLASERRPYLPHLTVARKARGISGGGSIPAVVWSVHEFALLASRPSGSGVRYEIVRIWRCAGSSTHNLATRS